MRSIALRCTAPHPKRPHWTCRHKLAVVAAGTTLVEVESAERGTPRLKCDRCGAEYILRPARAA